MEKFEVYKDIAKRTNGDIYIGVVGPVRTGKSTFINKFAELMIMPNIAGKNKKQIAVDEMPQSGAGKTITTTEPKFVPSEAVKISFKNKVNAKVRLIDCVGYLVDGAFGSKENDEERLVKTPWSSEPMPFEKAAEMGTTKVIENHSTIGIVVTTDGSICDIDRESYVKAEENVVSKLKQSNKPFIIILNAKEPSSTKNQELITTLTEKYGVKVLALDLLNIDKSGIESVLENVLMEFPLKSLEVKLPKWMQILPPTNATIEGILKTVKEISGAIRKMKDYKFLEDALLSVDGIKGVDKVNVFSGEGKVEYSILPEDNLFYKLLGEISGEVIDDEFKLMSYIKSLNVAKENYQKLKDALYEAQENGYGVVIPNEQDLNLSNPEVVKRGKRYGVKIKANTSCMHLIKINLDAEVSPISGTQKQCEDFAEFIKSEYEENPDKVWGTKVFGKPLSNLVCDEIANKINGMKSETKNKMRRTVTKIVNEGRGGVICILL